MKSKSKWFFMGMTALLLSFCLVMAGCSATADGVGDTGNESKKTTGPKGSNTDPKLQDLKNALSNPDVKEYSITDNIYGGESLMVEINGDKTIYIPGGKETDIKSLTLAEGSHVTIMNADEKAVSGEQAKTDTELQTLAAVTGQADEGWAILVIWNYFEIPDGATFDLIGKVRLIFRTTVETVKVDGTLTADGDGEIAVGKTEGDNSATAPTITGSGTVTVGGTEVKNANEASKEIGNEVQYTPPSTSPVTGVTLDPAILTIALNGTAKLTATVAPKDAANKAVIWASGDPDKVAVDQKGNVTGKAITETGPVTITVTTVEGEFTATCAVTVKPLQSIAITDEPAKTTYNQGETLDLTGLVVTATFSDSSTATVSSNDWTASPAHGDALYTVGTQTVAISYGGETAGFPVSVYSVTVNLPALTAGKVEQPLPMKTIFYGTGAVFTATVQGQGGVPPQTVTWTLTGTNLDSDTTIDNNGSLTVAPADHGKTLTVTATSSEYPGISGTAQQITAVSVMPSALYGKWNLQTTTFEISADEYKYEYSVAMYENGKFVFENDKVVYKVVYYAANNDLWEAVSPAGYKITSTETASDIDDDKDKPNNPTFFLTDDGNEFRWKNGDSVDYYYLGNTWKKIPQ